MDLQRGALEQDRAASQVELNAAHWTLHCFQSGLSKKDVRLPILKPIRSKQKSWNTNSSFSEGRK